MSPRIAIIDLGSNTTRLVVYEYQPGYHFHLVEEVREVVRLREGMGNGMALRAAAIERGQQAMRMFASFCRSQGIDDIIMTATSAVRDARNGDSFLARVRAETGWEPRLLSGEEEGYFGALGALNGTGLTEGFVVDLGGGSAQIVEVRGGLPGRAVSLPLGALRLSDLFLGYDRAKPAAVEQLNAFLAEQLAGVDWFRAQPGDGLVALGGTVRNLARIDQAASGFPLDMVNGYELTGVSLREMAGRFWQMSQKDRLKTPGLDSDRADIIQSGALAFAALLKHSGFEQLTISQQGLREGIFYQRFLADQPQPVFTDLRQFSVLNLARKFDCDNRHSRHVTALSLQLFDQLQPAHGLDASYRHLLWAAGMLHDIGMSVDYYYHHHHSAYIIQNSGLPGYSPRELALIALLAQYHRKGSPKAGPLGALFAAEDHRGLSLLAGMLRLAEFLERGRSQVVRAVRCHLDLANGWLQIETLEAGDARMELWDASRNLDVLQRSLNLHVELVSGVWLGEGSAGE
ncbi:MAG TPA: Ppx/GppA phosphatase family protein [Anaerolineae bacterium]|nr:Ppx/GppA phosphatase family protein [Anaerolineae bacterium]HNU02725.1 Ppx/GppA phosphatase family protein [Anaerolineae bacterium]